LTDHFFGHRVAYFKINLYKSHQALHLPGLPLPPEKSLIIITSVACENGSDFPTAKRIDIIKNEAKSLFLRLQTIQA